MKTGFETLVIQSRHPFNLPNLSSYVEVTAESTLKVFAPKIAPLTTVSWKDSYLKFYSDMSESWCLAIWYTGYTGSKNGTIQEFRHATYCRFIFHSGRGSSNDFFRNFKFVLVPNPAFLGIKNLMNFLTWLIYPILPLRILHRGNLYSIHWFGSWKYQWHRILW